MISRIPPHLHDGVQKPSVPHHGFLRNAPAVFRQPGTQGGGFALALENEPILGALQPWGGRENGDHQVVTLEGIGKIPGGGGVADDVVVIFIVFSDDTSHLIQESKGLFAFFRQIQVHDHTAVLLYSGNDNQDPYIRVTFTPAENAPQNIKEDAVPSELYFGYSGDTVMQYKMDAEGNYDANGTPKDIFVLTPMANKVLDVNITWPDEPTGGAFVVTYGLAEIKEFIKLNGTFVLDTKAEHDAFRTALSGNIVARITDGTVTGGTASN